MEPFGKRAGSLHQFLQVSRVIPAVRSVKHIRIACAAPGQIVCLLTGDVGSIGELVRELSGSGKVICVNIDLLGGLSGDASAVDFIVRTGAAGIISTHAQTLKAARTQGIFAIQRIFMLDSQAVASAAPAIPD